MCVRTAGKAGRRRRAAVKVKVKVSGTVWTSGGREQRHWTGTVYVLPGVGKLSSERTVEFYGKTLVLVVSFLALYQSRLLEPMWADI